VGFKGWSPAAVDFYAGLEADNSKQYWTAHRDLYETEVKAPMVELLAELEERFGESRMFRPYRDTRFSADKTPYKTSISATVGPHAYVSLSADGLTAGCGEYHLAGDQLSRYRGAVDAEASGAELQEIVARLRNLGNDVHGVDPLKTVPRGYPKDHPRADLLRNKGLVTLKTWPPKPWLSTASAKQRITAVLDSAAPLSGWFDRHVGREDP
jgi:uncharacterized protein (TIGR02453 family)